MHRYRFAQPAPTPSRSARVAVALAALLALPATSAVAATASVSTDYTLTLSLLGARFADDSPAVYGADYEADGEVGGFAQVFEFFTGVASGSGSQVVTYNGDPLDDTQFFGEGDALFVDLHTESQTSGAGGVGQRNEEFTLFYDFINWSGEDLFLSFEWSLDFGGTAAKDVAGDQAVGHGETTVTLSDGFGIVDSFELTDYALVFGAFTAGLPAVSDEHYGGTFEALLDGDYGYLGVEVFNQAVSNPRINAVPLPPAFALLAGALGLLGLRRRA
ncbi:MAG: hypothetical protein H6977_08210 [Gammaproteobacteria bacterium]|nr:hypothetical protein [Gammaproteobacteria bacterium]